MKGLAMAQYMISFPSDRMDQIPEEEVREIGFDPELDAMLSEAGSRQ
jgi:hypothetical protein